MRLWLIEPKINLNRLLLAIEFKNLVVIMIVSNSGFHPSHLVIRRADVGHDGGDVGAVDGLESPVHQLPHLVNGRVIRFDDSSYDFGFHK